jgi:amidase
MVRSKSYAQVTRDLALEQAHAAEKEIRSGKVRSPLHGVPIAVNNLCWIKDVPIANGMTMYHAFHPTEDATVVTRLRSAGAIILGKLKQSEGAYANHCPEIDPPKNPWDAELWPGVSSSGSGVATAAGLCYGSLGTDTGGSIRFPSAANAVTGLKPTWGRVSRYGAFEPSATLDHIGPMARSAADCGAMLGVIAGADPRDSTTTPVDVPDYLFNLGDDLRGVRVGVDRSWVREGVDVAVSEAFSEALRVAAELGAKIKDVTFPDPTAVIADWYPLCGEATAAHSTTLPSRKAEYRRGLARQRIFGLPQYEIRYQNIALRREAFCRELRTLLKSVDLLAIPAQAFAAPTLARMATLTDDPDLLGSLLRFTYPFDIPGSPTITLPAGFTKSGGPLAFQFVGRHFDEARLVKAGHAFQRTTNWHNRHPTLKQ